MTAYPSQPISTASLAERLANVYGERAVRSGRDASLRGASGYLHHIDLIVDFDDMLLLYACKFGSRIVPQAVLAFAARVSDIAAARPGADIYAYMVSNHGRTPGAVRLAEHFIIELASARSADLSRITPPHHRRSVVRPRDVWAEW